MGGHQLERGHPGYLEAARLGARPRVADLTVATGGGPGAMEAANLGAWMANRPDDLDEAIDDARRRCRRSDPRSTPGCERRSRSASASPTGSESLGIPTWHYGHEPPNPFATAIAKYFRNSTREATLLQVCDAGIVFLPGHGGTVQEIFQDACENYYADESSVAPMVLVGAKYWTEDLPAWPLLQRLARGKPMERHIHLVDSVKDAATVIVSGT